MKKLVNVQEVEGEGLLALLGQAVTIFSLNYIYHGILTGVNTHDVLLTDAYVVYQTGDFRADKFEDAQKLGKEWRLRTSAIESYGTLPRDSK